MKSKPLVLGLLAMLMFALAAIAVPAASLDERAYLPLVIADVPPTATPTPTPHPHAVIEVVRVVNSSTNDPLDEYVEIRNNAGSIYTLTGWFIRDENSHRYDFPDGFRLYGYRTIRVWSGTGNNTSYNLYWGSSVEIWNDVSDCAYLRDDSKGENDLVDVYCYGGAAPIEIP